MRHVHFVLLSSRKEKWHCQEKKFLEKIPTHSFPQFPSMIHIIFSFLPATVSSMKSWEVFTFRRNDGYESQSGEVQKKRDVPLRPMKYFAILGPS